MSSDSMASDSPDPLVTRFAPSPSGYLHLGNARTALLSYLAARKAGGRFILRVEDTDEARSSEDFMMALFADLKWLGLDWDEGPDIGGPHASYRQQERRAIYDEYLSRLDAAGLTYPCFCTPAELSISRKRQLAAGQPPRYAGTCRNLTTEERAERLVRGLPAALRFRVPDGQVVSFVDVVHGEQRFNTNDIGDFIIRRTDGSTAFFFSNAVDDALMGVTLVLRGDDHMTNTPRQILILQALNLRIPQYAHVALLLGMDGAPLSKRHGDTSLRDLREHGYLPGALRNHLVRLGHSCVTDGWLDDAALIADFDLNRLGRAAAKFDEAQLRHWQKETVAHLSTDEFVKWIAAELPPGLDPQQRAQFVTVVRANIELPSDARAWAKVIFGKLDEFEPTALAAIREAGEGFFTEALQVIGHPGTEFKQAVKALGQAAGKKGPALFMPLRAALTGFTHGPELAPMLALLPFAEVQARLEHARRLAV
ncbi:glutamate--tRNA ligase 2 [Steroidobacter agaridevorans]|uniref:Glutamate--tRNA ligase n=2 Tax=Steroidobacter agaridevorans TaxID=2695856 RepID=A0A829Y8V5_9GAMM|nr:glutamate--tRNA ligase 2 [Steroidobacter agaridevorans]